MSPSAGAKIQHKSKHKSFCYSISPGLHGETDRYFQEECPLLLSWSSKKPSSKLSFADPCWLKGNHMCPVHRHTSGSEMSKVRLLESQLQSTVKCGELFCFHAACWRCVFMLCTLGVLCTPPSFLNAVQKRAESAQVFYPTRKREAALRNQPVVLSWWQSLHLAVLTVTGLQEIHSHTAEYENSPRSQNAPKFPWHQLPRGGPTLQVLALLCLPVQCSQSISEGEAVQQWGLLSGTVFPAAHHQKGSRTWKQRMSSERRFSLTQHHGRSPGKMRNKPHFWLLNLFAFVQKYQPWSSHLPLSNSLLTNYTHEKQLSNNSSIPSGIRDSYM